MKLIVLLVALCFPMAPALAYTSVTLNISNISGVLVGTNQSSGYIEIHGTIPELGSGAKYVKLYYQNTTSDIFKRAVDRCGQAGQSVYTSSKSNLGIQMSLFDYDNGITIYSDHVVAYTQNFSTSWSWINCFAKSY